HYLRARGGGDGARARHPRRGRGGLPARRLVRQAPQANGCLGRVLRQGRNGRGQGGANHGAQSLSRLRRNTREEQLQWHAYTSVHTPYNAGSIKGAWLDLEDYADRDAFLEACRELHNVL